MRIWLDPYKLASLGIASAEVVEAIAQQNQQVPAGALGQPPMPDGQKFQYTLTALGRLSEPEQFREIVVCAGADGALVRLKDVARVELRAESCSGLVNLD
jgi:multidrug efflux pump subunit AcrB